MKTTEQHFDNLISEALKIGIEKMSIYGTSWTSYRPQSLLTRMLNKGKRIVVIQETKKNEVGEIIFKKAKDIMLKKDHDYGGAWRNMTQEEIIDEINVKIQRMKSVLNVKGEVSIDNVYDVINYCAFALILLEEKVYTDL